MNCDSLEHPRDRSPMVLVPAGPFLMGLPSRDLFAETHEKPQRQITLSAFWIDVYPVTNARFDLFFTAGGYDDPQWWSLDGWAWKTRRRIRRPALWGQAGWDGGNQPVAGVSWYEADAYARFVGRRLPSDAEWEKAARGTDGRRYPWGDDWPTADRVNFNLAVGRTTPVGLYAESVSPFGCHDMAGNVNNWTRDWYHAIFGAFCATTGLDRDPCLDDDWRERMDAAEITDKVDRGGGFATARECQEVVGCTRKLHWKPGTREPWNGFRTALDAVPQ
jgi:formylglycine-generating enzyme required for sulfatase activity